MIGTGIMSPLYLLLDFRVAKCKFLSLSLYEMSFTPGINIKIQEVYCHCDERVKLRRGLFFFFFLLASQMKMWNHANIFIFKLLLPWRNEDILAVRVALLFVDDVTS